MYLRARNLKSTFVCSVLIPGLCSFSAGCYLRGTTSILFFPEQPSTNNFYAANISQIKANRAMEFTFIDNNQGIDSDTRSLIRQRAAKGWNLGRKINRPTRVKAFERPVPDKPSTTTGLGHVSTRTSHEDSKDMFHSLRDIEGVLPPVEPIIGDSVSILSLPIEVAQKDRVLLYDG